MSQTSVHSVRLRQLEAAMLRVLRYNIPLARRRRYDHVDACTCSKE